MNSVLASSPFLSDWRRALSDAALRDLAGAAVFARGQTYAAGGAIEAPELAQPDGGRRIVLRATVQGTQPYQGEIQVDAPDGVEGDCDCPHAQDGNFCKHQVALALTLRGLLGGDATEADPQAQKKVAAAVKRAHTQARNREALRAFVQGQSATALADRLWRWAETDRDLMADLKSWAAQSRAGDDPEALTKAITELLRHHGDFLDWRESGAYARRAEQVLPLLAPWLGKDPARLRELCEHALRRLYKVAQDADDSNGEIGELMQRLMGLLIDTLRAAPPAAAWMDRWSALMEADPWGLWDERAVVDAAGPAVQARFAERAAKDWQAWLAGHPPPTEAKDGRGRLPSRFSASRFDFERHRLRRRYLDSLRRQDDPQVLFEALCASVQESTEYGELVAFCEAQGRHREALQWAEKAIRLFPKDARREDDLLRCYERDGWDAEVLAIRRRRLEHHPAVDAYRAVLAAAQRAGRDRAAYRAELMAWAEAHELAPTTPARPGGIASTSRLVSVRVRWLLAEDQLDEALALVQSPNRCDARLLLELARQLPATRDADAVPLLLRVFQVEMDGASSPYPKPLALVRETLARMVPPQDSEWLAYLRAAYKAKRNFIKELPSS